jgi:hypothetical protein
MGNYIRLKGASYASGTIGAMGIFIHVRWCHVNQVSYLFQGTVLEPSTSHIGKGVALVTQAAAPVYPMYISTFPSQIAEMITHS